MSLKPLTVPGKLESLNAIANYVMNAASLAHLDKQTTYKLRLAVDEIATNIIQHGYTEPDLTGQIICSAQLDYHHLKIVLEDWGLAYNSPKHLPPNNLQESLIARPIGGLGIYLAIKNVDDLQYARIGDRNRHSFIVKR